MATYTQRCSCKHSFQDHLYGQGMRVFNSVKGTSADRKSGRCTVCLTVKTVEFASTKK